MNAADFQLANEPTPANANAFDLQGWWNSLGQLQQIVLMALPVVGYLWWSSSKKKRKGKYDSSGDGEYLETV